MFFWVTSDSVIMSHNYTTLKCLGELSVLKGLVYNKIYNKMHIKKNKKEDPLEIAQHTLMPVLLLCWERSST